MADGNGILIDFGDTSRKADDLEGLADDLERIANDDIAAIYQGVGTLWIGDSGDEFKIKMDALYQKTINESRKLRNAVGGMRGAAARLAAIEDAARSIFGL